MNLNQITLGVSDIEKSISFYENLGLQLIVKYIPYYARFTCPTGNTTLSLHLLDEKQSINNTWIYFEVDDLDLKVKSLLDKGYKFLELPNDKPWLWRESRLMDLDENVLILYNAGHNRLNPPWKIKSGT